MQTLGGMRKELDTEEEPTPFIYMVISASFFFNEFRYTVIQVRDKIKKVLSRIMIMTYIGYM